MIKKNYRRLLRQNLIKWHRRLGITISIFLVIIIITGIPLNHVEYLGLDSKFVKSNFKEALKVYREFYHSDSWYIQKMGNIWVVKKNLLELIILIELDELDLVESRLKSFRKKHRVRLIEYNESRVLEFVKLISIFYYKKQDIYSEEFKLKVDELLKIKSKEEDVFTLSFYAWLKSKLNNSELYATCLEYIKM